MAGVRLRVAVPRGQSPPRGDPGRGCCRFLPQL